MQQNTLDRILFGLTLLIIFLAPVAILPTTIAGFALSKTVIISFLSLLALVILFIKILKDGAVSVPKFWLLGFAFLIPLVYAVAALLSDSPLSSFIGRTAESGTFFGIAIAAIPFLVIAVTVNSRKKIFYSFMALFAAFLVTGLFQIVRLVLGPDALTLGAGSNLTTNLVGKWNDFGIFFGLGTLLSAIAIEFLDPKPRTKILYYVAFVFSLFFVALVNYQALWWALGIFGIILLIYRLSISKVQNDPLGLTPGAAPLPKRRVVSIIAVILVALSFIFIAGGQSIRGFIPSLFSISHVEVRPSWQATFDVADETLREDAVFGTGPNRFITAWTKFKPDGVNETLFWQIDFNSGVGFIPTALVTTGLIGAAVWVLFLVLFVLKGIQSLFSESENSLNFFLTLSSFIGALYLWVFTFMYNVNAVLLLLAFALTGLFVANLIERRKVEVLTVDFSTRPAWNFIVVLVAVALVIVGLYGMFGISKRLVASMNHDQAVRVFQETGDLEAAEAELRNAVNLNESDFYYRALSDLYLARLSQIVQETPQTGATEDQLARFQGALGGAIESARRATELDKENYQNWISLGRVYESLLPLRIEGSYENAKDAYEQAIAVYPHAPQILLARARLEIAQGSLDTGREYIARAIEEKGNYIDAVYLLAQLEMSQGNVPQAIRTVEAATILAPNDPLVFFQLGILNYSRNSWNEAIGALERATTLTPVYANAKYFLGLSYNKVGRNDDAIREFEGILETNPDNAEVQAILTNLRAGKDPFASAATPVKPETRKTLPVEEGSQAE